MRHLIVIDPPNEAMCEAHIDLSELMTEYERLAAANAAGAVELQDVPDLVEHAARWLYATFYVSAGMRVGFDNETDGMRGKYFDYADELLAAIWAALEGK